MSRLKLWVKVSPAGGAGGEGKPSINDINETYKRSMKTVALYFLTALAEILGCYLPYLWLRQNASAWILIPAAASLAVFAWLLTLHPDASGRVYAAYGGIYIAVAIAWLWLVDGVRPTAWDMTGVTIALAGMAVIVFQPR